MPVRHYLFILAVICLFHNKGFTQHLLIRGRVVENNSQSPLYPASISIGKRGAGTVTNSHGIFELRIPATFSDDTLLVSFIGYRTQLVPLQPLQANKELVVTLERNTAALKEVAIEARSPLKIIRKAIDRIPMNYLEQPHITKGFYRLTSRRDQEYMQLSEAVFDVYNYGYANTRESLLRLERMRLANDRKATHGLDLGLKPRLIFEYDVVKDIGNFKLLNKSGLREHSFEMQGITSYDGHTVYEISFDQKEGVKKSLYKGRLFIDTATLAFIAIDYALSPRGAAYARYGNSGTQALLKLLGLDIDLREDAAHIRYRSIGNKWVIADVTANTLLNFRSKREHYNFPADVKVSYVITGVDTAAGAPFAKEERLGNNKLIEFQTTAQDAGFWKDYTIILPDFDAEAVVRKIQAANERNDLKKIIQPTLRKLPKNAALRIDSILSFYHRQGDFNGTALVKQHGVVILNKSYGYADKGRQTKADSSTQYRIGSLAKSFTGIVVMQLENEGKLRLTDPLKKYLPQYIHGHVTIEQLLTHSSGIPNFTANEAHAQEIMQQAFTHQEIVARFCSDTLEFESGTRFSYSNSGYFLLAVVCEQVTGKPFASLLQERVFTPLGMTGTFSGPEGGKAKNMAAGYLYGQPEPAYNTGNIIGAGGITSTAADLLKFDNALYTEKLLPRQKMQELLKPRMEYTDWDAYYGYGWMIDRGMFGISAGAHKVSYHPGTDMGFYTMFARQEDAGNCIILLNNTGDFSRFDITDLVLDELGR